MDNKLITPDVIKSAIGGATTVAIFYILFRRPKHH